MKLETKRFRTSKLALRPANGRSLGLPAESASEMIGQMQKGFAFAAIVRFHQTSGLPVGTIAGLIEIPPRTLIRRKAKGRFTPSESERLLRLAHIFEKTIELFEGDTDSARRWLTTANKELDNQTPLDFSRTEIGAREVEDLIGRLEHGVFS